MAPTYSRQLLIWTIPTVILFGYLWYKRKRNDPRKSDPGEKTPSTSKSSTAKNDDFIKIGAQQLLLLNSSSSPIKTGAESANDSLLDTKSKSFSRSLSGVDSSPIDIILPPELKATKSSTIIISDEDLDIEIEKIRSMRHSTDIIDRKSLNCCSSKESIETTSPTDTPPKSPSFKEEDFSGNAPEGIVPIKTGGTTPSESTSDETADIPEEISEQGQSVAVEKETTPPVIKIRPVIILDEKDFKKSMPKKVTPVKKGVKKDKQKMAQEQQTTSKQSTGKTNNNNNNNKVSYNNNHHHNSRKNVRDDNHKHNDRDSANHSPADVMLASPSLSSISDNHSEGSNDSGKGGSDVLTPPPSRTPGAEADPSTLITIYEFILPQNLVGKLIGKNGSFVTQIKDKTGAHVVVRKHPSQNKLKLCCVEGNQKEIDTALKLIRDRFPIKRFPEVTLEQVSFLTQVPVALSADHLYLKLIEGINNDTIVSCMVTPNHLFVQQPTHPSYPNLHVLNNIMNMCYSEADSPLLPNPIPDNTVCVAFSVDSWYRAMILSTDTETNTSYVNFLDYGGYAYVDNSKLRQIRGDFMLLPFQAAECFLANIKPVGDSGWCQEAYNLVAELTKGSLNYTQIVDYTEELIPLVNCYLVTGHQRLLFLNQELVNQGFAEWIGVVEVKQHSQLVEENDVKEFEEPVASSSQT